MASDMKVNDPSSNVKYSIQQKACKDPVKNVEAKCDSYTFTYPRTNSWSPTSDLKGVLNTCEDSVTLQHNKGEITIDAKAQQFNFSGYYNLYPGQQIPIETSYPAKEAYGKMIEENIKAFIPAILYDIKFDNKDEMTEECKTNSYCPLRVKVIDIASEIMYPRAIKALGEKIPNERLFWNPNQDCSKPPVTLYTLRNIVSGEASYAATAALDEKSLDIPNCKSVKSIFLSIAPQLGKYASDQNTYNLDLKTGLIYVTTTPDISIPAVSLSKIIEPGSPQHSQSMKYILETLLETVIFGRPVFRQALEFVARYNQAHNIF